MVPTDAKRLSQWVCDARWRSFALIADLADEQLTGPRWEIINPLLWEIGHVAWFQERWVLRHACGRQPIRSDSDPLYDSMAVAHDTRWDLALPDRESTLAYAGEVRDDVLDRLSRGEISEELAYFVQLSVFHEDMHTEAFTYTRQTLGYPPPRFDAFQPVEPIHSEPIEQETRSGEDVWIPGGRFLLGATGEEPFVFDNEKWAHPVDVQPFRIAQTAVTQRQFADFVDDGGYHRPELWSEAGWQWRESAGAEHPVYWKRADDGSWRRRDFDRWVPLENERPVLHVNWYEAEAYCRWAGRRLPTEAEWELAAAGTANNTGKDIAAEKRRFPWGEAAPSAEYANLDWHAMGTRNVSALPAGDSAFGCRQMLGNVWEWTASDFHPYPGFVPDPYKEYSQPWFGDHKVLRGGCWATRSRLIRNTYRNFYQPHRRDVWAGLRTCAVE